MPGPPVAVRFATLAKFLELQNLGLNLPFALGFLFVAVGGLPSLRTGALIVVAFVAARNAGHSFNRWADRSYDSRNPRTADRLLVVRPERSSWALAFAGANGALLVLCAALLSPLALALVPVAIVVVIAYSYTKRFTSLTTIFLGLVEAMTPAGVYAGATGSLPPVAILAAVGMLAWGTAFETIHSLGDRTSDRSLGLRSLPETLGVRRSLAVLGASHATALLFFLGFGALAGLRWGYYLGIGALAIGAALVDARVARDPDHPRGPFRAHFLFAGLFLLACLAGLFGPFG